MKLDLKQIPNKLAPVLQMIRGYGSFIIVIVVLGMFGFIVLRIRSYATVQPSQAEVDQKLQDLKRTHIDEEAIKKIQELESTNVDVKALFDDARDNPFQE